MAVLYLTLPLVIFLLAGSSLGRGRLVCVAYCR